ARALERIDIGAIVDVGRREPMTSVMARQEDHRQAPDLADAQLAGRLAPRALDAAAAHLPEAGQVVDAGATNDAEHGSGHAVPAPCPLVIASDANQSRIRFEIAGGDCFVALRAPRNDDFCQTKGPVSGPLSTSGSIHAEARSVPNGIGTCSRFVGWRIFLSANRCPPRIKSGAGFRRNMR